MRVALIGRTQMLHDTALALVRALQPDLLLILQDV